MSHGPQRKVRQELDARIPRGASGSPQNMFRMAFYLFRVRGATFEDSVASAPPECRPTARFVKKQPMRWTPLGAHLPLWVHT